jgi:hypothetical protein
MQAHAGALQQPCLIHVDFNRDFSSSNEIVKNSKSISKIGTKEYAKSNYSIISSA